MSLPPSNPASPPSRKGGLLGWLSRLWREPESDAPNDFGLVLFAERCAPTFFCSHEDMRQWIAARALDSGFPIRCLDRPGRVDNLLDDTHHESQQALVELAASGKLSPACHRLFIRRKEARTWLHRKGFEIPNFLR
ncbi:hypothetical protein [Chitinimonas sp. BJYL2]|uniref:hypothetical protein n=1 Tax=Chitinimonas sp. BJYL2 TaxID=2976696 RepID=UPI0022B472DA|nr:hypothetical protein [Chitinimonas sp. BJYL2]